MKDDNKNVYLAIALSILVIIGWNYLLRLAADGAAAPGAVAEQDRRCRRTRRPQHAVGRHVFGSAAAGCDQRLAAPGCGLAARGRQRARNHADP